MSDSMPPPPLPAFSAGRNFRIPVKKVKSDDDMKRFKDSTAFKMILGLIENLAEAIKGNLDEVPLSSLPASSPHLKLKMFLEALYSSLEDFPPVQQPMRFGNKAFSHWHDQFLQKRGGQMLEELLPPSMRKAMDEVFPYLLDSFGNPTRVDYGTGHELSFVGFLAVLLDIGFLPGNAGSLRNIVKVVFTTYLKLVRKIQKLYLLEPAGSRGVWGLDDYQFLPFYLGAAQLEGREPELDPREMVAEEGAKRETMRSSSLFADAICTIFETKTGAPFHETSPLLFDISQVPSWSKIKSGLLRMYIGEVLLKKPVVQHFLFGSVLDFE